MPVLMLAAGEDHIVSTRAIEELGVKLKLGSHLLLPGALHEIVARALSVDVDKRFQSAEAMVEALERL